MPAEYTYQVYMGFGFHPHMTLRPPLRKQIFFRGGGDRSRAHLRIFWGLPPAPSRPPAPAPGEPTLRPLVQRAETVPVPAPVAPPAPLRGKGERDSPGLTSAPPLLSSNVRPCALRPCAVIVCGCWAWRELWVCAVPPAVGAMQKKLWSCHCGMKKIYYLRETKDGDGPRH